MSRSRRLPPLLAANPRLDQWVGFPAPGQCRGLDRPGRDRPGRADRDAADRGRRARRRRPSASLLQTGDTDLTPNEGYTAGSQSIQFGGVALAPGLRRGARPVPRPRRGGLRAIRAPSWRSTTARSPTAASRPGRITGRSPARSIWRATPPRRGRSSGPATTASSDKARRGSTSPPRCSASRPLSTTCVLDGMVHARVVRQPRRGATIATVDEAAIRRAAKGPIEIVRDGNFLAILGSDETVVEAAAAVAPAHVAWDGVDPINPYQEEARWLLQQPSIDRTIGRAAARARRRRHTGARRPIRRMHIAHASVAPSCGLAVYRDGQARRCGPTRRASTRCAMRWRAH